MRAEKFKIVSSIRNRTRTQIWDSSQPMAVDHRFKWILEKGKTHPQLRFIASKLHRVETNAVVSFNSQEIEKSIPVQIPNHFKISLKRLKPIPPAYFNSTAPKLNPSHAQLIVFCGSGRGLVDSYRVPTAYIAYSRQKPVFSVQASDDGYHVRPLLPGLFLKLHHQRAMTGHPGEVWKLTADQLTHCTIVRASRWWRFKMVPVTDDTLLPLGRRGMPVPDEDNKKFRQVLLGLTLLFGALSGVLLSLPKTAPVIEEKPEAPVVKFVLPSQVKKPKPKVEVKKEEIKPEVVTEKPKVQSKPKAEIQSEQVKVMENPKPHAENKSDKAKPEPVAKNDIKKDAPKPMAPLADKTVNPNGNPNPKLDAKSAPASGNGKASNTNKPTQTSVVKASGMSQKIAGVVKEGPKGLNAPIHQSTNAIGGSGPQAVHNTPPQDNAETKAAAEVAALREALGGALSLTQKAMNKIPQNDPKATGLFNSTAGSSSMKGVDLKVGYSGDGATVKSIGGDPKGMVDYSKSRGGAISKSAGSGQSFVSLGGQGAEVEQGLLKEEVGAVIRQHQDEIRYCHDAAQVYRPGINGRLMMSFSIDPTGRVEKANIQSSTVGDSGLENCLLQRFVTWKFPKPKGGIHVAVTYPIELKVLQSD